MPESAHRQGRCAECGCSQNDHEFGPCLGEAVDKKTKKAVRCKFEWSQCLSGAHSESDASERVDCLVCPKHPNDGPQSFRTESQKSQAKQRKKTTTKGIKSRTTSEEKAATEKGKKKKPENGTREKAVEAHPHDKDQKSTKKGPGNATNIKSSAAKAPTPQTEDSSGDELAWDQDKAEEDALAQQMQQLSLRKARDQRSDDPDRVEWKRVYAWTKDDEVVYFRDPETGGKQRTMMAAWTEETRRFGKVKRDCLVLHSRKDRRAFYCESFEDEEPRADT